MTYREYVRRLCLDYGRAVPTDERLNLAAKIIEGQYAEGDFMLANWQGETLFQAMNRMFREDETIAAKQAWNLALERYSEVADYIDETMMELEEDREMEGRT